MPCERVRIGDSVAIVCSRGRRKASPACVKCGCIATRECDWKVLKLRGARGAVLTKPKPGTCDAPLCDRCTHQPAPDKDLCPEHAAKWAARATTTEGD